MENVQRVINVMEKFSGDMEIALNEISESTELTSIGLNSLSFVKVIIALEEEFDIEFDDEFLNIGRLQNIGDLVVYINTKVG